MGVGRASSGTNYGYDDLSRLTSQGQLFAGGVANVTHGFGYNPASQIVSRSQDEDSYRFQGFVDVARSYATNGLNQYTSAGPASFTYDPNGNLTSDGTRSYLYDVENRLVSSSDGAELVYDPKGRLFQISKAGQVTQFVHDGDQMAVEYDGAGSVVRRFMFAGVDEPILEDSGSALNCSGTRFLHTNHQGSIIAQADCWGNRTHVNAYDEYGIPQAGNVGRFQYTGQAWLAELGMYYYKARIYSPTLGRFLQTDPIGYEDQVNLYAYVGNDPINRSDPTGLYTCQGSGKECTAVAAVVSKIDQSLKNLDSKSSDYAQVKAASEYLARDDVVIKVGNIEGKANAQALQNDVIKIDVNKITRSNSPSGTENYMAGTVAHEAKHQIDNRSIFKGRGPQSRSQEIDHERRAYNTQGAVYRGLGFKSLLDTRQGVDKAAKSSTDEWCKNPINPYC